ncbi:PD-(D/E)XK nuclease family protein [Actinoplanes sp. NPDC051470]|uniref:RecB family exonuclease n=1 Tax=Actinoplanes sp. NPDC051470 TaxID=3157224 RepID=UPI003433C366
MAEPVTHRSVSQFSTFTRCGESYRLERVARAPAKPAAWFAQGIAYHTASEAWERSFRELSDRETTDRYDREYDRLIAQGMQQEPDPNRWLTGGRVKGSDDIPRRKERGREQLKAYFRYARAAPEKTVRVTDEDAAVEVPFRLDLDGIEIVGFIDTIVEWPGGIIGPRDWKTGSKRPDWPLQLGVYALAVEDVLGVRPMWGDFYMAKDGKPDRPVNLQRFTRGRLTRWFHNLDQSIRAGLFLPNPGDACRTCGVSEFCTAVGSRPDVYPPTPITLEAPA